MMLLAHPVGNAFVRAALEALQAQGLLAEFDTTLGFRRDERWIHRLPGPLARQLARRAYDLPAERLHRRPLREVVRLNAGRLGLGSLARHETGWASIDAVGRDLSRDAATRLRRRPEVRGVYGYEDFARELFAAAAAEGLPRCYDLPIGYWREAQRIFAEEAERQPDWAVTLDGLADSPAKLARKDEELALATEIVVASEFTRSTLARWPGATGAVPVHLVPYGAPTPVTEAELKQRLARRRPGPLRVLFVGGLSQRKGLAYLLAAMEPLTALAQLTLVGRRPPVRCAVLERALATHRHIPSLAPAELFGLMREHDVLVLPSLFEGFGLVLLEAMAQGLPVIGTPHTAAPELLGDTAAGVVVPIRASDAIAQALERWASDRAGREAAALAARSRAETFTWRRYGERVAAICRAALASGARVPQERSSSHA